MQLTTGKGVFRFSLDRFGELGLLELRQDVRSRILHAVGDLEERWRRQGLLEQVEGVVVVQDLRNVTFSYAPLSSVDVLRVYC